MENADPEENPTFSGLIYGVTNQSEENIKWLEESLYFRKLTTEELAQNRLLDLVDQATPPAFLVHAYDDETCKVEESTLYAQKLFENKVPVEMHLFAKGGHGFGVGRKAVGPINGWRCLSLGCPEKTSVSTMLTCPSLRKSEESSCAENGGSAWESNPLRKHGGFNRFAKARRIRRSGRTGCPPRPLLVGRGRSLAAVARAHQGRHFGADPSRTLRRLNEVRIALNASRERYRDTGNSETLWRLMPAVLSALAACPGRLRRALGDDRL